MVRLTIKNNQESDKVVIDLHSTMVRLTIMTTIGTIVESKSFTFHYG